MNRWFPWLDQYTVFRYMRAFYRLYQDPQAPAMVKIAGIAVLLYLLSPIDIIMDFIPIIGWLDDALVLAVVFLYLNPHLRQYLDSGRISSDGNASRHPEGDVINASYQRID